ncbi:hypothetical protein AAFC00_005077 [Neodothiora populina]
MHNVVAASNSSQEAADLPSMFEKQLSLHSQFPSLDTQPSRRSKGKKENVASIEKPHRHPSSFFQADLSVSQTHVTASAHRVGAAALLPARTVVSPGEEKERKKKPRKPKAVPNPQSSSLATSDPAPVVLHDASTERTVRSKTKKAIDADRHSSADGPKTSDSHNLRDEIRTRDTPNTSYTAGPPPPKVDHSRKRGSSPRRLVLPRPFPTAHYIQTITQWDDFPDLATSLLTTSPRPLLVILDLNGVIVHRGRRRAFVPRPGLGPFLDYLFANHHVMIWSSGLPSNVIAICSQVFTSEQQGSLVGIWGRDKLHLPEALFKQNIQVYKQLSWIWESKNLQKKAAKGTLLCNAPVGSYKQSNTVLVDDTVEKGLAEPFNLLKVDEFIGQHEADGSGALMHVMQYLERLKWARDVSVYMHHYPFDVGGA